MWNSVHISLPTLRLKISSITLFILFISQVPVTVFSAITYNFCQGIQTYTTIFGSGTKMTELYPGSDDDMTTTHYPIGFTFTFDGVGRTTFDASTNGWMTFNSAAISSQATNNLAGGGIRPGIAPLWDDLAMNAGNSGCYYLTTGTSPNRVLTVEWYRMAWKNTAPSNFDCISFQVKLYETSNVIDFCYSQGTASLSAPTASIGLCGATAGNYYTMTSIATPAATTGPEVSNIATKPPSGQVYRWSPSGACSLLPIELLSFTGQKNENENLLEWRTATEINNSHFTIERSEDGDYFTSIANLKGAGNSTGLLSYKYSDNSPSVVSTLFYYRLKQTDFDGKYSYSEVISIKPGLSKNQMLNVYAEPGANHILLLCDIKTTGNYQLNIVDMTGRQVFQSIICVSPRQENIFQIPFQPGNPGIYIAKISGNNLNLQSKFIKN